MLNYLETLRLRDLTNNKTYHILEMVEAREHRSTILCTQFDSKGCHSSTNGESDSVIDRIIYNSYRVTIHGLKSMRERHGINSDEM